MSRTRLRRLGGRRGVLVGLLLVVVLGVVGIMVLGARERVTDYGSSTSESAPPPSALSGGGAAARDSAAAPAPAQADPGSVPIGGVTRSLVRTAQLSVDADDPVAATRRVRAAVAGAAGTVSQESSTDSGAQLTIRVPADRLDQLIDSIAGLGHVTNRTAQVVDATEDVVDLGARVASQRASVDRVRALLSQARSIGDVVAIESELTRREADLDSLTGRLTALKDQVALSTLVVDVEKAPITKTDTPQPNGFLAGLAAGWEGLQATASATGAVVGFLRAVPARGGGAPRAGLGRTAHRPHPAHARAAGRRGPAPERGSQDRATPREPLAATTAVRGPAGALWSRVGWGDLARAVLVDWGTHTDGDGELGSGPLPRQPL